MKRSTLILYLAVFAVTTVAAHYATLDLVPGLIMDRTIEAMQKRGMSSERFTLVPRVKPETQTVVRPSPDLAYSICLFNFTDNKTPLYIAAKEWPNADGYASVSFFDARTNNFKTVRVMADGKGTQMTLLPPNSIDIPINHANTDAEVISAPTERGIILIRRLAASDSEYAKVQTLAANDQCKAE
jgi:uncharacterized membrane protein